MVDIRKDRLFYLSVFSLIILSMFSYTVLAGTATASFTTANEAPPNSSSVYLQDGFTNALQCSGGESWDAYDDDSNMTTHMLNATIRWDEGTDTNGQNINTFVCIATTRSKIDSLTQANESDNTNCDILNAWNEDDSYADNTTGVTLNVDSTMVTNVDYDGTHNDYYGALMAWDNTYGSSNRSYIVYFNFTILNNFPVAASSLSPSSTHDTTPDLSWTPATDADDGSAADKCPADNITQYWLLVGNEASGDSERVNTATTTPSYTWIATALDWGACGGATTTEDYFVRINATDGHTGTIAPEYDDSFDLTNDVPSTASALQLNQTEGLLHSHSPGPRVDWTASTDTDVGDTVTYYFNASTSAYGDNDLVETSLTTTSSETFFDAIIPWGNILNPGNWTNKTVYVRILAADDSGGCSEGNYDVTIQLTNRLPTGPTAFNTSATHDQTPNVEWVASTDEEGDIIYYRLVVGTAYGDTTYENDTLTDPAVATTINDTAIPWDVEGQETGWNNNTVYVSLYAVDHINPNITAHYENQTMQLVDYLPNVLQMQLSDTVTPYGNCTVGTCTINPVSGTNISLATKITIYDEEDDCANYTPTLHLCLNSTTLSGCEESVNSNFSWLVETYTRVDNTCVYEFGTNLTYANNTPYFFTIPGNYKYNINATGFTGNLRDTDAERNVSWIFGTLSSVNYSDAVILGGSTITLGSWSSGENLYTMTNFGNNILDIRWNTTYLGQAGNLINWTPDGTDFQIDDDNSQSSEATGLIAPTYLNATDHYYNYSTGLERCVSHACDSAAYNETLPTYYHIQPPLGLPPGTYSGTITYNIETHNT